MIKAGPVGRKRIDYCQWDDDFGVEEIDDLEWCEKGRNMISKINVSFDEERIRSIQFGYLENGAQVLSTMFGSSEGHNFRVVRLNEDEYVTGLSGVLGEIGRIRNLTFHTNRGKHGPIGCLNANQYESGSKIEIDPAIRDRSEFGGFFGSCGYYDVSSIGIYVNSTPTTIARSDMVVKRENI